MINFYLTKNSCVETLTAAQEGCWISMTSPNETEIKSISQKYAIDPNALRAALDIDESSRVEVEDNYTMVIVNIPTIDELDKKELYNTIPLAIILTDGVVITICSEDTPILHQFIKGEVREFHSHMKSRFILQILYKIASTYLHYLRILDRKSDEVENKLHKSTRNSELIELLKLEKSLVYFTTALRSNEVVLEKLFRNEIVKKYPEDSDLLEDVIIENKQAIEMAKIHSGILSGMMDAFASVISNNLNIVMKTLAIITIVMSIPNIIFSALGMNINFSGIPFVSTPYSLLIWVGLSVVLSLITAGVFVKMKVFK
ncbi:MAG: Magnesium transport protein CorA [Firmicutes bacterium ADurb.Bin300]|nr:MAG: Magnesium transport protein CorA [Firmicutes bacterium ADurb.Bin300]